MTWSLEDFKEFFLGDAEKYKYGSLCMPTLPWTKTVNKPKVPFYSKDEPIPFVLAALMGLQHSFAMVGGLITPPYVIFRFSVDFNDVQTQQYAISAALIASGICSIIQVTQLPIPFSERLFRRKLFIGSGVLSVMGVSFTFLPIFEIAINQMKANGIDGNTAYGNMLGTSMVCCLLEVFLSLCPIAFLHRVFPPLVSSITVILIGVALTGTGMKYWGGGVVCAEMVWKEHDQAVAATGIDPIPGPVCTNGEVNLGYGSAEFIGLGFSVMIFLVFIELFGSVFMKNCNVILALLFGYFIAGVSDYQGANYVDPSKIEAAAPITFLWVETFPLGFYAPAVIPLLIGYIVTTTESVGDITATYEVSLLDTNTEEYDHSIQGGLFSDAFCSILSGLMTVMPNTTFSQNNGVISLTKCAARRAGVACGVWLIVLGVFSKIAGLITSIPDCVIGGMTIFLFANVLCSGIAIAATLDLHSRRVKFIMALSLAVGVGVTVWPFAFIDMRASVNTANFWRCDGCSPTVQGIRDGVSIFLSTGYCVGTVIAIILNTILPEDAIVEGMEPTKKLDETKGDPGIVIEEEELEVKKEGAPIDEEVANGDFESEA